MESISSELPELTVMLRLLVAAVMGGLIGLERECDGQPAGLRTHIIMALGAALAMCVSVNASGGRGDPARIAAQVVSGVGFLGAGAIFKYGGGVRGLTTAASVWTTAAIGLAAGSGMFVVSVSATLLVLFSLIVLNRAEKAFIHEKSKRQFVIRAADRPNFVAEISKRLGKFNIMVKNINFAKDIETGTIEVRALVKSFNDQNLDIIICDFQKIEGLHYINFGNEI